MPGDDWDGAKIQRLPNTMTVCAVSGWTCDRFALPQLLQEFVIWAACAICRGVCHSKPVLGKGLLRSVSFFWVRVATEVGVTGYIAGNGMAANAVEDL